MSPHSPQATTRTKAPVTCLEFANSAKAMRLSGAKLPSRDDPLSSSASAAVFLDKLGVLAADSCSQLSAREMTELQKLRGAVENLLSHFEGRSLDDRESTVPVESLAVINSLASRCMWTLQVASDLTASYVAARQDPVAAVAALCAMELSECDTTRLQTCERPECRLYFYDTTRNRSARWHAEDPCGWRIRSERRLGSSRVS